MGGEYFFKVRGEKAKDIVFSVLTRLYGSVPQDPTDPEKRVEWFFPTWFCWDHTNGPAVDGPLAGIDAVTYKGYGEFQVSYKIWAGSQVTAYIYALCAEIRKHLLQEGLDFYRFGNYASGNTGNMKKREWLKIMERGYFVMMKEWAKTWGYYRMTIAEKEKIDPNYLKRHDFLVYLLQKRLEDFK